MVQSRTRFVLILFLLAILVNIMLWSCKGPQQGDYSDPEVLRIVYSSGDPSTWPSPEVDSLAKEGFKDVGVLPEMPFPEANPYSKDKAALGKLLFFEPRLSRSGQIACASCHNPELAWTDNITRSFGHNRQNGKRNAMTILNVGHATSLFWDGRAESLEDQAKFPIADPMEMHEELPLAVEKIAAIDGYHPLFEKAFGNDSISLERIQMAIATFERTVKSEPSKFDRFISGKSELFTDQEVLGLHLFRTKARCINCHNSGYFSDNKFHNDGQALFGSKDEDFGRFYVTGRAEDAGKFKTPTLREVTRTGPWMHHGNFPTIRDVIEFYNLGNPAPVQKKYLGTEKDSLLQENSSMLKKLNLTEEEKLALEAFLATLTTPTRRMRAPELPR